MGFNNNRLKKFGIYAKYTGLAFQMLAIIGLFSFIGYKIDECRQSDTLLFTAIFGLIGVIGSLCNILTTLIKNK